MKHGMYKNADTVMNYLVYSIIIIALFIFIGFILSIIWIINELKEL